MKIKITIAFFLFLPFIVNGQEYIIPDSIKSTVNYSSCLDYGYSRTEFEIKNNSNSSLELLSISSNFVPTDVVDNTGIFIRPGFQGAKNIILETNSSYFFDIVVRLDNHQKSNYSSNIIILLRNSNNEIFRDTVFFETQVLEEKIFTRKKQNNIEQDCFEYDKTVNLNQYSRLYSCDNELVVEDIIFNKTPLNISYEIIESENVYKFNDISLPYNLGNKTLSLFLSVDYNYGQTDTLVIDYITNQGIFSDTLINSSNKPSGLLGKTNQRIKEVLLNDTLNLNDFSILLCSQDDYIIKDYYIEGQFNENDIIDIKSNYSINEKINTEPVINLFDLSITPNVSDDDRTIIVNYNILNINTGNILNIKFPIILLVYDITSVTETQEQILYPNPAKNILNLNDDSFQDYKIYDINGRIMKSGYLTETIDISELSNGIYYIELRKSNKQFKIEKFIKH